MERVWLGFLVAGALTYLFTPAVRLMVIKLGVLKHPGERGVHQEPVPHLGGIALVIGVLGAIALLAPHTAAMTGIVWGGLLIALLGLVDDLRGLPAWAKFLGQVAVAIFATRHGITIQAITNPFGGLVGTGWAAGPLTVFWLVAVMNTVNLIDGLDGLAAGLSGIAALTLLTVALRQGEPAVALLAAAVGGSAFAFLRYNFNPAKIFMGDTGSLFLGFLLGSVSVIGMLKDATAMAMAVPILALGIPIFDTGFAIVRRLANHRPIGEADRGHLHHRLLDLGLSQRQAVLLLYGVSLFLGTLASSLAFVAPWETLVMGGVFGLLLASLLVHRLWRARQGVGLNPPE